MKKKLIDIWQLVIDLAILDHNGEYNHDNVLAVIAEQEFIVVPEEKFKEWAEQQ